MISVEDYKGFHKTFNQTFLGKFSTLLTAEVECTALEKTSIIRTGTLLFPVSDFCWLSQPENRHVVLSYDDKN